MENLIIVDGMIHPNDPDSILRMAKKYPNHYPVLILMGEMHLMALKDDNNVKQRDNVSTTRLIYDIRRKQDKTQVEELLLQYHYTLANISEILVSESKQHIETDKAIHKIREIMKGEVHE